MRKAQASAAGSLIGIILLIFIFYIVFLPQEERQRILAEPPESVLDERQQTAYQPATLFREGIGRLEFTPTTGNKILLPNAFLEETKEARLLATTGAFNIKKFITRKTKTIEFSASTKTAILTFQVLKAKAILKIELNGKTILEDRVTTPQPIQLTDLKEYNKLTFSVTGGIFESKN
ncbi:hypothetical protein HY486_02870 [Candidatus Woesearchaeota archaeon]|nr:hypothetical protein [Candidatus Woesearchaeota archaeon]